MLFRASKWLRSSGPEKLPKIVNHATNKETEKLKETMVGVQVELVGGYKYPPGSSIENFFLAFNITASPRDQNIHIDSLVVFASFFKIPNKMFV